MDAAAFHRVATTIWPRRPAPFGWARVPRPPDGVPRRARPAASACQLWREATQGVSAVDAEGHGACPVGRMTMGFASTVAAQPELVEVMTEIGYLDPVELSSLPMLPEGHEAIVYGPLRELPVDAEAVLLIADAAQLMLLGEAAGLARLDRQGVTVTGRPTCAAIPAALREGELRGSFACIGARVYADLGPGELLAVVPATRADAIAAGLERAAAANAQLERMHVEARRVLVGG